VFERSLLERIAAPAAAGERRLQADPTVVARSVMRHLRELLNVRRGSVLIRADYGMNDLGDLRAGVPGAIEAMEREVQHQIQAFEPRLSDVSVRHIADPDNPLSLRLRLSARLRVGDETRPIRFETVVGDDGRCSLQD